MIGLLCAILVTEIINRGAESQINNTVISKLYTREGLNNKIKILKYFQIIKILFRRSLYTLQFSGGGECLTVVLTSPYIFSILSII